MSSIRRILGLTVAVLALTACGGGGSGGGDSTVQPPPTTPTHTVTTSVTGSGSGSISPTSRSVTQGSTTSFTISPATGSTIASVSGCGGWLSGTTYTTGAINSTCTVTARFDVVSTTPTISAGGVWRGYARLGIDWYEFSGLVTESGRAYFTSDGGAFLVSVQLTNNGNVITGGPISPANSVIAVLNGDPGFYYLPYENPPLSGLIQPRSTLDAETRFSSGEGLLIELGYQRSIYEQPASLDLIAGTLEGYWELFDEEVSITITATGQLTARVPQAGCSVNGSVSVPNRSYNLYEIQYTFSGCSDALYAPLNGVTFTGLATRSPGDENWLDPYLYLEFLSTGVVNGSSAGDHSKFRLPSSTSAGGIWNGTMTISGAPAPVDLDGLITESGLVWLRDSEGRQVFGNLMVYEDAVGGYVGWALPLGKTTPGGNVQGNADFIATLAERQSLSGQVSFLGSNGEVQNGSFALSYDPTYEKPSSIAVLAGTYQSPGHTMIVAGDGTVLFTSTVTGCVHQGTARLAGPYNAYWLDLVTSNCVGEYEFLNGTEPIGVAYLMDEIQPSDTLVFRSLATRSDGRAVVGDWALHR